MQENNDGRPEQNNLTETIERLEAYGRLVSVGRFLQTQKSEGTNPEIVAKALQSFDALVASIAKAANQNYIVWLSSWPSGEAEITRHTQVDIGPAPLAVINSYLKSIQLQHELAGAEIEWGTTDDPTDPAWTIRIRYPHIQIMLAIFEEFGPSEAQGAKND